MTVAPQVLQVDAKGMPIVPPVAAPPGAAPPNDKKPVAKG